MAETWANGSRLEAPGNELTTNEQGAAAASDLGYIPQSEKAPPTDDSQLHDAAEMLLKITDGPPMHHSSSELPQSDEAPPMDETVPDDATDTITITRTILEVPRRPRGRPPGSKNKPKRLKIVSNMAETWANGSRLEAPENELTTNEQGAAAASDVGYIPQSEEAPPTDDSQIHDAAEMLLKITDGPPMHHSSSQLPQSDEAPPMDETVPDDPADTITITRTILDVPRRPRGRPPGSKNKPKRLKIVSNMAETWANGSRLEAPANELTTNEQGAAAASNLGYIPQSEEAPPMDDAAEMLVKIAAAPSMDDSSSQFPQTDEAPPMDETVPDNAADTITITRTILEVPRRPRGRPPGSKNKPKRLKIVAATSDDSSSQLQGSPPENSLRSLVLEVAGGCDVAQSIANFARRRQIWVWVLSGNGIVTNVTLREPTNPRAGVAVSGMYQIQYLSGMFSPGASSSGCGLTVLLVGMQGQVVGGSVIGPLIAAGPVIINAAFSIDAPQQTT
ncbi:hypothetical protein SUGI_0140570 [Cryptomeria japonica]|nr:hypothetical protein SUGI_0140570 [Cryptomeria japonica]